MLIQRFLVQFGSGIFLKLLGMVSSIVVARVAGPEVVGIVAYGISYASVFTVVTGIWGPAHIKLISEGQLLKDCMGVFVRFRIFSLILFFILGVGWLFISKNLLSIHLGNRTEEIVVYLSFLAIVTHQLVKFLNSTFQAKMEQVKANIPDLVKGIIFNVGRMIVVILGFTAIGLIVWDIFAGIIGIIAMIILFRKLPIGEWNKDLAKKYWEYAKPIILFMIVTVSVKYLDKIFLVQYTSTKELGYYSVAFSLGGMLLLMKSGIGVIFFPLFSKYLSERNSRKIYDSIKKYQEFILFFIFPIVCFIALISTQLIELLYGQSFSKSAFPFIFLLFSSYITLFEQPFQNMVTGAGKFYWRAWISVIKSVLFIIIFIIMLSPATLNLGALGLAITVMIIQLLESLMYISASKRIIQIKIFNNVYYSYLLIGGLAAFLILFISLLRIDNDYVMLLLGVFYLIICYSTLFYFSIIKKQHLNMFLQVFNFNKLYKYINKEIS